MEESKNTMHSNNVDLESTNYDPGEVKDLDRRLEAGRKDATVFHGLGVGATVIATIWMYTFGTGDPSQMKYLLGMPMWISGAILIYLAMFVIGMIYISRWEEFPLTGRENKKDMGGKK